MTKKQPKEQVQDWDVQDQDQDFEKRVFETSQDQDSSLENHNCAYYWQYNSRLPVITSS